MSTALTCKVCRRLGFSICGKEKCAYKRKPYPPGVHGRRPKGRRRTVSEYGVQLSEKQRVKFLYGMRERPFKNLVAKATTAKGVGAARRIIESLEGRLDNVVFRLKLAPSRAAARQLVGHGHILVDLKPVKIPSYQTKPGQTIHIRTQSQSSLLFRDLDLRLKKYEPPAWLSLDKSKKEGRVLDRPKVDERELGINLSAVIEFYSR